MNHCFVETRSPTSRKSCTFCHSDMQLFTTSCHLYASPQWPSGQCTGLTYVCKPPLSEWGVVGSNPTAGMSRIGFYIWGRNINGFSQLKMFHIYSPPRSLFWPGWGNSIMVSIFVCQAGLPGSNLARSVWYRKVKIYQPVINLSPPVPTTGSQKAVHVLSCLCDNACKRYLAISHTSRASYPISRLLSVPI